MGKSLTMREAEKAFRAFQRRIPVVAREQINLTLVIAQRLAITKYMQGLGNSDPFGRNPPQPPNPPPGPLGIRSGTTRRAVGISRAKVVNGKWAAALTLDKDRAPGIAAHEFGARTKAHIIRPRAVQFLRWRGTGPSNRGSRGSYRVTKAGITPGGRIKAGKYGGFDIFARVVHHPGSRIPPRPFATPALRDAVADLGARVERELSKPVAEWPGPA